MASVPEYLEALDTQLAEVPDPALRQILHDTIQGFGLARYADGFTDGFRSGLERAEINGGD